MNFSRNLSRSSSTNLSPHENTPVTHLILCLLLILVPASQMLVHWLAGSGLWQSLGPDGANIDKERQSIGILFNLPDNLYYTSLAIQNSIGIHFMKNLYTTEPNLGNMFNLYYLGVGALSDIFAIQPLTMMIVISFAAPPIVGYVVFVICRQQLKFAPATSLFAVALVILGSGPSLVLRCINVALAAIGIPYQMPIGVDYSYINSFPVQLFLVYPYHSVALASQVLVFSAILKALQEDLTEDSSVWVFLSAAGISILALIRPYEAFIFSALFPVTMLLSRIIRGRGVLFRYRDYLIIAGMVGPFLYYIVWVSSLPGWREQAHTIFNTGYLTWTSLVVGYSAFWFVAITGILRVFRERRLDMLILCLWTFSTMLLLIGFGGSVITLASGAVIAYGILGAFGLEKIQSYLTVHPTWYLGLSRKIFRALVAIAAGVVIFGTSLSAYDGMIRHEKIPAVDTEILAATALIRQDYPGSTPTVLSDCSTALALPALAAARVYSGHWALTPDFVGKCRELEIAGLEDELEIAGLEHRSAPGFDESRLEDIVNRTKPDFILIRRGTSAEQWLFDHHAASGKMTGQRWSLLVIGK
jgi:hypothetical protein